MKRRILSIITALALCLSLFPVPARAAGTTLTKPLDFTNVGDGDGQTPASGDGYELTGNSSSGYTLTLNGISMNITDYGSDWTGGKAAIRLPTDGSVTVELKGTNIINSKDDGSAIGCYGSNAVTFQGDGALSAESRSDLIHTEGNMIIKNTTIGNSSPGAGLFCLSGNITIENAVIQIESEGSNSCGIFAQNGNVTIKDSTVTVFCKDTCAIGTENGAVTITGGTIKASSNLSGAQGAITANPTLSIGGNARVFANVEPTGTSMLGLFAVNVVIAQSEVSAKGSMAGIGCAGGSITLQGMGIAEPAGGQIGNISIVNGNSHAAFVRLTPPVLSVPTGTFICTYGDTNTAKVTLTTTPAISSTVEIYGGGSKLGEGNLGEEITINTGGLSAGNATFTAKLPNGLGEKDFIVKINPKPLTVTGATATNRGYDGTREVEVTAVTLDGVLDADSGKVSVDTTNLKGTISGAGVGTYDSVTLPEMTLTGAAAGNYTLTQPTGAVPASVAISKAEYKGDKAAVSSAKFGTVGSCDLSALLEGIDGAAAGAPTASGDIFDGTPAVSGMTLSYTLKADATADSTGTITVPVTSTNYQDFNLTVTVTVTDKDVPALTVSPITVAYTGKAVPDSAIQGTATVNGQTVTGTWAFAEGQRLTDVADSGAKTVKFTPEDEDNYAAVEGTVFVTISKATPAGTPTYTAISAGGKTLADAALTAPAGWPNGDLAWSLPRDTAVTANTQYEWTFTPEDTANYNTVTGKLTLWVQSSGGNTGKPSGGSSSGGSSTSSTPPVTTDKTTEGSVSTTETTAKPSATTKGDTASSTVSTSVGSEIVKQAEQNKSDNVVIAPEIKGNVTKTEVSIPAKTVEQIGSKTQASLTVSTPVADVTIPNGALSSLAGAGGSVAVTAEVKGNTVELSLTAGGETVERIPGGVILTVPAENTTPGTVAVLVHEDGTREVVRKSVAGDGSITIPLEDSARLEIVDNSKSFDDVPEDSWAADAVAFASAHELFNGTGASQFSPEAPMTRGMLAVVLHNLESNPAQTLTGAFADVDNSQWYAEGVAWAASQGIVSGYGNGMFGPNDNITREQLAVMLWRYSGSPAATNKELHFNDADEVSGFALEAMRWAVEHGIVNGYGDGRLGPKGLATRAQVAQMLKNYLER